MRTSSMQFAWLTPEEAHAYLVRNRENLTTETWGDRVAMTRRAYLPVTTPTERAAARAYTERAAIERFQKVLRGEWPASGPIIPSRIRALAAAAPAANLEPTDG